MVLQEVVDNFTNPDEQGYDLLKSLRHKKSQNKDESYRSKKKEEVRVTVRQQGMKTTIYYSTEGQEEEQEL